MLIIVVTLFVALSGSILAQTASQWEAVSDSLIAAEDLDSAAVALREAYGLDETNAGILRKLADVSLSLGDFAAARQALNRMVEMDRSDAESYLELARVEWLAGSLDLAIQYVDLAELASVRLIDKVPAYRSIIYRGMGQLAEAESVLVAARKQFPESSLILSNLGLLAALVGDTDKGFEYMQMAYEFDSNDASTISSLAGLHLAEGNVDEARRLYERALNVDPLNYFTRQSLQNFDRIAKEARFQSLMRDGVRYFDMSLYLKARKAFRKAIELDSTYFDAHLNLGFTLNLIGEPRNAIEVFERAELLDSMSAPLYIGLGNALAGIGEFDRAIEKYERAIELDSTIVEVHEALRTVQELRDRSQE